MQKNKDIMIEFTRQENGMYQYTMLGKKGTMQIEMAEGGRVVLYANLGGMTPCVVASAFSDNVIINLAYTNDVTLTFQCEKAVVRAKFVEA